VHHFAQGREALRKMVHRLPGRAVYNILGLHDETCFWMPRTLQMTHT
jgi:hypothetical protein